MLRPDRGRSAEVPSNPTERKSQTLLKKECMLASYNNDSIAIVSTHGMVFFAGSSRPSTN